MARRPVATGAAAERARVLAADRDGVPWRCWVPILDDRGMGTLPGISGLAHETSGLRLAFALVSPDGAAGAATVVSMIAAPTASYLHSSVRIHTAAVGTGELEIQLRCAKRAPEDIVIRLAVTNRGSAAVAADLITRLGSTDDRADGNETNELTIRAPWEALGPGLPEGVRLLTAHHGHLETWWLAAAGAPETTDTIEEGTSAALRSHLELQAGETRTLALRLSRSDGPRPPLGIDAEATLGTRAREAAAFQRSLLPASAAAGDDPPTSQALARLLWQPLPAEATLVEQVFAALGLAVVDAVAAQHRLSSVIDQHLSGPVASTEPPVAAWAALRIHELVVSSLGRRDHGFLEGAFHALLEDYSRWVDRLDPAGRNPLQGGLLGPDGTGSTAAGAAWMACYSVWMLSLAVELARDDPTYQDVAATFLDTTLAMVAALDDMGGGGIGMWQDTDGWYHDVARADDGTVARLPGRSAVGLVPLLAVAVIPRAALDRLPEVAVRLRWSLRHEADPAGSVVRAPGDRGSHGDVMVSLAPAERRRQALAGLDLRSVHVAPPMACLLLDVLDRLRAFGDGDPVDVTDLRSRLMGLLDQDAPIWANLLAGALRRAR